MVKAIKKNDKNDLLVPLINLIADERNPEIILDKIIELISEVSNSDSVLLYILDPKEKTLRLRASNRKPNPHVRKVVIALDQGITEWVAKYKKIVEIPSKAYTDPRFLSVPGLAEDKYEAFLSLPITFHYRTVGVINIQQKDAKNYNNEDIEMLSLMAKQLGGSIENIILQEKYEKLRFQLEAEEVIDKAKRILIKKNKYTEPQAYAYLQKLAMTHRKSIKDIADIICAGKQI